MHKSMEELVLPEISDQAVVQNNIRHSLEVDIQICVFNNHKFYICVSFYYVLHVNICLSFPFFVVVILKKTIV